MAVLLALHTLAVVIWVGGMFFAHMVLRPSTGPLRAEIRLPLWHRVFERFFPWVWLSVVTILASGFALVVIGFGGFAQAPGYVNVMMAAGIVMAAVFFYIFFGPWQRFRQAVPARSGPRPSRPSPTFARWFTSISCSARSRRSLAQADASSPKASPANKCAIRLVLLAACCGAKRVTHLGYAPLFAPWLAGQNSSAA